MSLTVVFSTAV